MNLNLSGKTALITGSSRGIGFGIARVLASEGCSLHLASRDGASLERARQMILEQSDVRVDLHPVDLRQRSNVLKLAEECEPLDVLVNNAGAIAHGYITDIDDRTWREAWDLKVFGYIDLIREIYPKMCARKSGVIINICGGGGERPAPHSIAGCMANATLNAMSRALGSESLTHGVRVIAVNPGGTETDRQRDRLKARAKKEFDDENRWREFTKSRPGGRFATVEEIADTVAFLCSDRSGYTTGTVIAVDGGAASRKGR